MNDNYRFWKAADAFVEIKKSPAAKFNESIDMSLNLSFGSKKTAKKVQVRGVIDVPNGVGKLKKVAIIAKQEDFDAARAAGADFVGGEDFLQNIASGAVEYDCYITTPDMMKVVSSSVAKVLGPRGLMPNIKSGTVTNDFAAIVPAVKHGTRVEYKSDRNGVVNMRIGSMSFDVESLSQNLQTIIALILSNKPDSLDKMEVKSIYISSTMGKSYKIENADKQPSKQRV